MFLVTDRMRIKPAYAACAAYMLVAHATRAAGCMCKDFASPQQRRLQVANMRCELHDHALHDHAKALRCMCPGHWALAPAASRRPQPSAGHSQQLEVGSQVRTASARAHEQRLCVSVLVLYPPAPCAPNTASHTRAPPTSSPRADSVSAWRSGPMQHTVVPAPWSLYLSL